jgi:tetratricopeptide (TPR) repeat protein
LGDNLPIPSSAKIKKLTRRSLTEKVFGSIYTYIIVLVLVFAGWWIRKEFIVDKSEILLFLPIKNNTNTDTLDYLFAGMHEALIGEAGKISAWQVISRTTANTYKNVEKSMSEIVSETNSDKVVEMSISCFGEEICVQVAAVDAREDKQLWHKEYTVNRSQIPNLPRTLAKDISKEMKVTINPREKELLAESVNVDPVAYDLYMKGQFYKTKYTPESFDSAMQCFELAKEIDPDFVLAYTGICDVWNYRTVWGKVSRAEGNLKSMEALMIAYALDSNNAVVQALLAFNKTYKMYDWEGGEILFKKSISLNPNEAETRIWYYQLLILLGRYEEALEQIDIARKLDPMNPFILMMYGNIHHYTRKYDEAIKVYNNALDLAPGYEPALCQLWYTFYYAGRTEEEAYEKLKLCWSIDDLRYGFESVKSLEQGYLKDGFKGACISLADRLAEVWTDDQYYYRNPMEMALLYSIGQETDKSIYWLEMAYQLRDEKLANMLLFPFFDNVRNDPRFKDLCQRINHPHASVVE